MKEKPNVGKAFFFSIIAFIAFYLCYFVVMFAFAAVYTILDKIPIIGSIVRFLFTIRGDSPDILAWILSTVLAYNATVWMLHRFHDTEPSENLSLKITGITLLVLNVIFLVVNIISGTPFFPNIAVGISGFLMFRRGNPFDP